VLHDDTLDRTTNLRGKPLRFAADELDEADAGSWFEGWKQPEKVPRLDEVLAGVGARNVVNVELKGPTPYSLGLERRALASIRAHPDASVIVSSFHPAQLLAVRRFAPHVPVGLLVSGDSLLPLRTAWAAPLILPDAIHPPANLVDGGFVARAHQAGMRVNAWAVDGARDAERLLALGVDGLIVDDVAAVAAVFRAHGYVMSR
jgi:glycerophosphoryl diester phosphodiesterase